MNQKLLNKKIEGFISSIVPAKLAVDGSNAQDFFCADVVAGKKFAQNHGGYPRSDIAEINAQENAQIQLAMLKNLEDFSSLDKSNVGLSDAEIALSHKSRYQQTPSEMQDWIQSQLEIRDARFYAAQQAAAAAAESSKKVVSQPKKTVVPADPE